MEDLLVGAGLMVLGVIVGYAMAVGAVQEGRGSGNEEKE